MIGRLLTGPVTVNDPAPAETAPTLDVEALEVHYRTGDTWFTAVEEFSLRAEAGQRIAVVGESGSGKTTACMALAGLLPPDARVDAARAHVAGTDVSARKRTAIPHRVPGVSVVFQNAMNALDPVWTIESQLITVIRGTTAASASSAKATAADWLARVGLHDIPRVLKARPYELSGGMRQRVMIAIALCSAPRLLIADEPTSALDMTLSRDLLDLIVALTDELDTTLLMISHDIGLCRAYTDWTVVMNRGRIVEQGATDAVTSNPTDPYTRALLDCQPSLSHMDWDRLPTMVGRA
ncbi:ABC transporter ATP-binding protein [Microbacterium hatanonis]|uniref:ABC transporter ATP-binding protein n=1 Tax=Microbacterium hatanonis TaxID=404366 RepID=A0A5C8I1E7_9MICO|nr:ABC transporter ATP-binding protein [Microbacterium hatanonis]TXK12807.1 ABC transporter ATP-binding protein [Microbacterium hatanonis]